MHDKQKITYDMKHAVAVSLCSYPYLYKMTSSSAVSSLLHLHALPNANLHHIIIDLVTSRGYIAPVQAGAGVLLQSSSVPKA